MERASLWRPFMAATVTVAFLWSLSGPAAAQKTLRPSEESLLEDSSNLHSTVRQLIAEIDSFSCVDMTAYKRLMAQVDNYEFDIAGLRGAINHYYHPNSPFHTVIEQEETSPLFTGLFPVGLTAWSTRLGDDADDLEDALKDLKICPPNTTYSAVPPSGPVIPGHVVINPPALFSPWLGGKPANPPPSMSLDTEECKPCGKLAREIEEVDEKIKKLEREQASLRRANNPQLDKAIREDEGKVAVLKQQKAVLQAKLEKCRESCQPKQTGMLIVPGIGNPAIQTASSTVQLGVGVTALVPHTRVSWLGTGTGGGVTSTFSTAEFVPTIELDVPLTAVTIGTMPVSFGVTGNLLIPTQGTSTRNVVSGGFAGTESFRQDVSGSAFLQWAGFLSGPSESFYDFFSVPIQLYLGAGAAFNHYQASSAFPAAGDNFSVTHTDVVPAFEAGASVNFAGGASAVLLFQDFLPGRSVTMPEGSLVSYGQAKAGNALGFTGKITIPLTTFVTGGR